LGCPDWPGCYGHIFVPESAKAVQNADMLYPADPVVQAKAWSEMAHRYAAGTLALLIITFFIMAIVKRSKPGQPIFNPIIMLGVVAFQAALGKWTVTMELLPVVVMGHLLGGLALLSLLWLMRLQLGDRFRMPDLSFVKKFRFWALLGLLVLIAQIVLGGWTSANYAALACPDFPLCHGQSFPIHEFKSAFNVFMPIGRDFQGGVLDSAERVTIHMMHRYGALITGVYLALLGFWIVVSSSKPLRCIALTMLLFLAIQITLGILNVELMLPLPIAVMHNAFAALLLLSVVTLNFALYAKQAN
jgi:heme a synthase